VAGPAFKWFQLAAFVSRAADTSSAGVLPHDIGFFAALVAEILQVPADRHLADHNRDRFLPGDLQSLDDQVPEVASEAAARAGERTVVEAASQLRPWSWLTTPVATNRQRRRFVVSEAGQIFSIASITPLPIRRH
jgi:hypothetical protein